MNIVNNYSHFLFVKLEVIHAIICIMIVINQYFVYLVRSKVKVGFHGPFNRQGHTGTGPQLCHLRQSNTHRGDSL